MKRFDEADKELSGCNYVYMRRDDKELFYELGDITNDFKMVGLVSFDNKKGKMILTEDDFTEGVIHSINMLVEDVNDVPGVLACAICAADPSLDFTSAYNVGMEVVESAEKNKGYTHNNVSYMVTSDKDYYYIIIAVA